MDRRISEIIETVISVVIIGTKYVSIFLLLFPVLFFILIFFIGIGFELWTDIIDVICSIWETLC